MVAPLHTYIHALADVFKRPDLPMALPKSTLAPTNIVGNDAVKALLFYIKIIMPVGLTLAVDFVVIVTINCFLFQENENILSEKVSFNENAIFCSDL